MAKIQHGVKPDIFKITSRANGRQEKSSQQLAKQTKLLRPRQGEVRGETPHRGNLQPASPEASKNRCRCPAGAIRAEAWRSDRDHPKDRLQRGNRGVQELEFHGAEGHRGDSQRSQRKNGDQLLPEGEPVRILGETSTEGSVEETLGTQTIQTAQEQRLPEIVNIATHPFSL